MDGRQNEINGKDIHLKYLTITCGINKRLYVSINKEILKNNLNSNVFKT